MSSSKLIRNYQLDRENAVVIEVNDPMQYKTVEDLLDDTDFGGEEDEISPEEMADNILKTARAEAERIKRDAQNEGAAEVEAMREAANSEIATLREQARTEGYTEGITAATHEGDGIRAQARQVLSDAEKERIAMQESLEPEMVDLLVGIASKLLNNAVTLNPGVILALVRMGMQNATITGDVTVYVSADDYEEVIKRKDEIVALTDGSVKLEIVKDLSLNPMDCVIETPFGSIDASLGQQFETLKQNITYLLNM